MEERFDVWQTDSNVAFVTLEDVVSVSLPTVNATRNFVAPTCAQRAQQLSLSMSSKKESAASLIASL